MTKVPKELQAAMGVGMEDIDMEAMPILKILQKTGAEVDETHEDYSTKKVEGGKAGDLYFAAQSALLGESAEVIPLSQSTLYAEWRSKEAGGGIVGHHPRTIVTNPLYRQGEGDKKYKEYLGDNELKLTIYYFVLLKLGDEWVKAILPFASSNLKHGRALGKMIRSFKYDDPDLKGNESIFSRTFIIKTQLKRGHGNSWYEYDVLPGRVIDLNAEKDLLLDCVNAREDAVASLPQPTEPRQLTAAPEVDEDVGF